MKRLLAVLVVMLGLGAAREAHATVTATPDPLAFGQVALSGMSTKQTSLSTDQASETVSSFDNTGCTEFTITTTLPVVIVNGTPQAIDVTFAPTPPGNNSCSLTL